MERAFIIIALALISATAFGQGFRGVPWGSSMDAVIKEEGEPFEKDDNLLVYTHEVDLFKRRNIEVYTLYIFAEEKLVRTKYVLNEYVSENETYISLFEDFKAIITSNYGKPKKDEEIWRDKNMENFATRNMWGYYLRDGDLTLRTLYKTDQAEILIILESEENEISLVVQYVSNEFGYLEDKVQKRKAKRDF
jgi:hypothetical protein